MLLFSACRPSGGSASASAEPDAGGTASLGLRVPAALMVGRSLDALSVTVDPDSLGSAEVTVHPGRFRGIESHLLVFRRGREQPVAERTRVAPGTDFGVVASTWSASTDGIPVTDAKYVVEARLVVFETDVPPSPTWNPRAGREYAPLWTRTLRQAEE